MPALFGLFSRRFGAVTSRAEQRDLHEGSGAEDVQGHLKILREDLDVLDALPWPEWRRPKGHQ